MIYLILLLAVLLRLVSINQSLWLDEATSALAAKMSLTDLFSKFLPGDFHPPLYYLLLHFWVKIFGTGEFSLRVPSIIFGILTIYIVYKLSKNLIAPAFLATSGLLIYYSQEARMYSMATFLVSLSIYLFVKKKYGWLSISLFLLGMTDYVSLLIIPVFFILDFKKWKKLIVSLLPLIAGFLLWMPTFIRQLESGLAVQSAIPGWWQILGQASLKNIGLIPVKFILGRISFDDKFVYSVAAAAVLGLFLYAVYMSKKAEKVFWLWLVLPIVLGIILSIKVPTLSYFRFLFCLPALYILISKSKAPKIFIALIFAVNLFSSFYYLTTPRFWREDWRSAASAIGRDVVVYPAPSQKEALIYYGKSSQITNYSDFSGGPSEIWLSRYVWQIFDPNDLARKKVESLGYNKVQKQNFNGVELWKYKKI